MSMSIRQEIANDLAELCVFGALNDSYGVSTTKSTENGKTYWVVTFAKARVLNGVIRVYSPGFIQVKWQGSMGKGSEVLRSGGAAKTFIQDRFVQPYV